MRDQQAFFYWLDRIVFKLLMTMNAFLTKSYLAYEPRNQSRTVLCVNFASCKLRIYLLLRP